MAEWINLKGRCLSCDMLLGENLVEVDLLRTSSLIDCPILGGTLHNMMGT